MSTLDRRVQILVRPDDYRQLEREAVRTGQSVAALIREAIAARLGAGGTAKASAAAQLLASVDSGAAVSWSAAKSALERELAAKLP